MKKRKTGFNYKLFRGKMKISKLTKAITSEKNFISGVDESLFPPFILTVNG